MTFELRVVLPSVLPKAIAWGESQCELITQTGQPLNDLQLAVAKYIGVVHPELIRVAEVSSLPQPEDHELREIALDTGLFGSSMVGMTIGYGVYVCHGYLSFNRLSHAFRYVQQYEKAGSIAAFLRRDLEHMAALEYGDAPFELDAQEHVQH